MKDEGSIFLGILIAIGLVALFLYFRNKNNPQVNPANPNPNPPTPTPKDGDPCVTSFNQNGTWQNGVCVQVIVVNPTNPPVNPPNNPPLASNQIKLTKVTPVYYQFPPSQTGYPNTYSPQPVSGITLPAGKVITIVKVWQSFSGQGNFYETTEPVMASLVNQVSPHYFIKETDIK